MRILLPLLTAAACQPQSGRDPGAVEPLDVQAWIDAAGNTEDDAERTALLTDLRTELEDDDPLAIDLDALLPVLDQWSNGLNHWEPGDQGLGEDGYLGGFFVLGVWPEGMGTPYPPDVGEDLEAIRALYRGRMLVWAAVENGLLTDLYYAEGRDLLTLAAETYPDNRIPRMYLGEPIPRAADEDPNAPKWANDQRLALTALADHAQWWIDNRQAPDGQFGGGWGDDVEMWRNWTPVLLGFEDPSLIAGWERLAEGLWALPRMEDGYSDSFTDVEHSAEDSADTLTSMIRIRPDAPQWAERADHLVTLFDTVWTAENDLGLRQFQSTWFDGTRVDDDPSHACDTTYHARAVQPALLRMEDPESPIVDWLITWTALAAREENGKSAGLLPSSMHWPSGTAGGPGDDWWDPGCHFNPAPYAYPRFAGPLLTAMVVAHRVTEDPRFLDTLAALVSHREAWRADPTGDEVLGSAPWAASQMGFVADALAVYRTETGDTRWDATLATEGDPYQRLAVGGDRAEVEAALASTAEAFRWDWPAYTSEVRFTDRLFKLHSRFINETAQRPEPKTTVLYQTVTGDVTDGAYGPVPAVRWQTSPRDIAVFVTASTARAMTAEIFVFGEAERAVSAQLYRIDGGVWTLTCAGTETGGTVLDGSISILVPSRTLCTLQVDD